MLIGASMMPKYFKDKVSNNILLAPIARIDHAPAFASVKYLNVNAV